MLYCHPLIAAEIQNKREGGIMVPHSSPHSLSRAVLFSSSLLTALRRVEHRAMQDRYSTLVWCLRVSQTFPPPPPVERRKKHIEAALSSPYKAKGKKTNKQRKNQTAEKKGATAARTFPSFLFRREPALASFLESRHPTLSKRGTVGKKFFFS